MDNFPAYAYSVNLLLLRSGSAKVDLASYMYAGEQCFISINFDSLLVIPNYFSAAGV